MDYLEKLSVNPIAKRVKLSDLEHNSDLSHLEYVDEKAKSRAEKYKKAIDFLRNMR